MSVRPRLMVWSFFVIAAAWVTYGAVFRLPLISDDYVVLLTARNYGDPGGWQTLASDALYRCRATFMVLTHFMDRWFGVEPLPYNLVSLGFHCLNCVLVLALGTWKKIGWHLSLPAAIFFAADQSHQEAVLWFSALPDEMVFFFVVAALLVWIQWLERPSAAKFALTTALYLLALLSKESGVAAAGLLVMAMLFEGRGWKETLRSTWLFGALAGLYFLASFGARDQHLHFNDGTFRLGFHFIEVVAFSMLRLLWLCGVLALAAIAAWSWRRDRGIVALGMTWMVLSFLPYSFLTYMPFVPSRHTYIAGVGVALIVAAGFQALIERIPYPRLAAAAAALLLITVEAGYLVSKKQHQYLERAAPTEQLLHATEHYSGHVVVRCFPYSYYVALAALQLSYGDRVKMDSSPDTPGSPSCDGRADFELVAN